MIRPGVNDTLSNFFRRTTPLPRNKLGFMKSFPLDPVTVIPTTLNHMFDSLLELRQEELIARERTHGLSNEERLELWTLNQELAKK